MTREARIRKLRQAANAARKTHSGGRNGGRPPEKKCPCGSMTRERAKKRGHKCEPAKRELGERAMKWMDVTGVKIEVSAD